MPGQARSAEEFGALFAGLKLVSPGVVVLSEWRASAEVPRPLPSEVSAYGAVARKPTA